MEVVHNQLWCGREIEWVIMAISKMKKKKELFFFRFQIFPWQFVPLRDFIFPPLNDPLLLPPLSSFCPSYLISGHHHAEDEGEEAPVADIDLAVGVRLVGRLLDQLQR